MGVRAVWSWRYSIVVLLAALVGCGPRGDAEPGENEGDNSAQDSELDRDPADFQIKLQPTEIRLGPGESQLVEVQLSPPQKQTLHVALKGNPSGAYLDTNEVRTDSAGRAELTLTVATESPDFVLLVTSRGVTSEVTVNVNRIARANLLLVPEYSGQRAVDRWHVTVTQDAQCERYSDYDQPTTQSFRADDPIMLEGQRADAPVSVLISGKEYVFGCRRNVVLEPNQENTVRVTLTDRPVQLSQLDLPLSLGIEASAALQGRLNAIIELMVQAFGKGQSDADAILREMRQASDNPDELTQLSQAQNWRLRISEFLADGAETGLSDIWRKWLLDGSQLLYADNSLTGRLQNNGDASGRAIFELLGVAGLSPRGVGVPDRYLANLSAEPNDTLRTSLGLHVLPSKLLVALAAESRNLAQSGNAEELATSLSAPELLSSALDCPALSRALTGEAPENTICSASCVESLCRTALSSMVTSSSLSVLDPASITILARGVAQIDAAARPLGFSGTWVGETDFTTRSELPIPVQGPFSATPED